MITWNRSTFTHDGFLLDRNTWSFALAEVIAHNLDIKLTEDHWRVILGIRKFYDRTGRGLTMRTLVRVVRNDIDKQLGSSIALARLFGKQTSRHVAMLSGLPKPHDCI